MKWEIYMVNWGSYTTDPPFNDPAPNDGPGDPLPDEPGWAE